MPGHYHFYKSQPMVLEFTTGEGLRIGFWLTRTSFILLQSKIKEKEWKCYNPSWICLLQQYLT